MRYEQVAKMGFVPTPLSQVRLIREHIQFPEDGHARIFDPCCGRGEALAELARGADNVRTYGIELDGARAEDAAQCLDVVRHSAVETARVQSKAFGLLWLNPPYDGTADGLKNVFRKELLFLRNTSKYLVPGGVLVFIIPQKQLGPEMAQALVSRYTDIAVYRFEDDEYAQYGQIVVFGYRREGSVGGVRGKEARAVLHWLEDIGKSEADVLQPLSGMTETYVVPKAEGDEPIFRASITSPLELAADVENSPVLRSVENLLGIVKRDVALSTPLLPFRRTHMATLIAAGALNGALGIGEARHLVIGQSHKVMSKIADHKEEGRNVVLSRETYKARVRVYRADGEILTLE